MDSFKIVIESLPQDVHAHALVWALRQKSIETALIFSENFPSRATLDMHVSPSGMATLCYEGPESSVQISENDQFRYWARRCAGPILPGEVATDDKAAADRENVAALAGFRELASSFNSARFINALDAKRRADRKPYQLKIARDVGFEIPRTLFSNNADEVRKFIASNGGNVIFKTHSPLAWKKRGEGVVTNFMAYSYVLATEDLPSDKVIGFASAIYQQEIKKSFEVRVVTMGSSCFASKLNSQELLSTAVDWRAGQRELATEEYGIPLAVQKMCTSYLRKMGLVFGCFDFVVSPNGSWIFLECNEQGQWLWQEAFCPDLPLLDAFTQFICDGTIDFQYEMTDRRLEFQTYRREHWLDDWQIARIRNVMREGSHVKIEGNAA